MICKYCNQTVADNALYCPNCGGSLGAPWPPPNPNAQNYGQGGYPPQTPLPPQTYGQGYPPQPPYGYDQQPYGAYPGYGTYGYDNPNDRPGAGWKALGFFSGVFLGLFSLIIYFVTKAEKPRCASAFGKYVIIGAVSSFVFGILFFVLMVFFIADSFPYEEYYEYGFAALRNLTF